MTGHSFFFLNATPWHGATPVTWIATDPFFNATPRHRITPLSLSGTDPFFNTTLWHRATLLSRSVIACIAIVSVWFRTKERERRVKHRAKKWCQQKNGEGAPRGTERHFSRAPRPMLSIFFLMPPRGTVDNYKS